MKLKVQTWIGIALWGLALAYLLGSALATPVKAIGALLLGFGVVWVQRRRQGIRAVVAEPQLVAALGTALVCLLQPNRVSGLVILLLGAGWVGWQRTTQAQSHLPTVVFVNQFLGLWGIFLAAGVWQWPDLVVLVLTWLVSYSLAVGLLRSLKDKSATVLAASWALICTQAAWVFTVWLVNYLVGGGWLVVPQPAIVLTALGYCFGGIYLSHHRTQLSRARLTEYLLIGLSLIIIVIAGTKWNGSV